MNHLIWKQTSRLGRVCFLKWSEVNWIEVAQSCPTLLDPMDCSPPGSPVPGILQARTLEWVAISFSSAWKWKVKVKSLSHVQLSATPWTAAYQAPPSLGFSRRECWSGVPFPHTENEPFCTCCAFQKALPLGCSLCTSSVVSLNPSHFSLSCFRYHFLQKSSLDSMLGGFP